MSIEEIADQLVTTEGHRLWCAWQSEIVPVLAEEAEWVDDMEGSDETLECHLSHILMAKWDFDEDDAAALAGYYRETR